METLAWMSNSNRMGCHSAEETGNGVHHACHKTMQSKRYSAAADPVACRFWMPYKESWIAGVFLRLSALEAAVAQALLG